MITLIIISLVVSSTGLVLFGDVNTAAVYIEPKWRGRCVDIFTTNARQKFKHFRRAGRLHKSPVQHIDRMMQQSVGFSTIRRNRDVWGLLTWAKALLKWWTGVLHRELTRHRWQTRRMLRMRWPYRIWPSRDYLLTRDRCASLNKQSDEIRYDLIIDASIIFWTNFFVLGNSTV